MTVSTDHFVSLSVHWIRLLGKVFADSSDFHFFFIFGIFHYHNFYAHVVPTNIRHKGKCTQSFMELSDILIYRIK